MRGMNSEAQKKTEPTPYDEFSITNYISLLESTATKYRFSNFVDIPWGDLFILWRHDIDFSINRALRLAKIEESFGVKATYLINPHSNFYNVHETSQRDLLLEILAAGHKFGVHLDCDFHGIPRDTSELERQLASDAELLRRLTGFEVESFSFHNPDERILKFGEEAYAGLANCYSNRLMTETDYCSDSNGIWRFESLSQILLKGLERPIQVLTHPGWWQDKWMSPRDRVLRCVEGRMRANISEYDALLHAAGRPNIS